MLKDFTAVEGHFSSMPKQPGIDQPFFLLKQLLDFRTDIIPENIALYEWWSLMIPLPLFLGNPHN